MGLGEEENFYILIDIFLFIIFLFRPLGGWYCFDQTSCRERWLNMKSYMTSRMWPEVKKGRKYSREENITPKTQISMCLVTDVSVSRVFDKGFSPGIYT